MFRNVFFKLENKFSNTCVWIRRLAGPLIGTDVFQLWFPCRCYISWHSFLICWTSHKVKVAACSPVHRHHTCTVPHLTMFLQSPFSCSVTHFSSNNWVALGDALISGIIVPIGIICSHQGSITSNYVFYYLIIHLETSTTLSRPIFLPSLANCDYYFNVNHHHNPLVFQSKHAFSDNVKPVLAL